MSSLAVFKPTLSLALYTLHDEHGSIQDVRHAFGQLGLARCQSEVFLVVS